MMRKLVLLTALPAAVLGFPLAAASGISRTTDLGAYGNILTPSQLSFRPANTTIALGDIVRWTNHDALVPHTATEDHGLWDLAGSYGGTPVNPSGFGPGTSVQRAFEAGTQHYYCRVHPRQMHGVIAVPVMLSVSKRTVRRHKKRVTTYTIAASWDASTPASGLAFDVRRASGSAAPGAWLTGTSAASASFTTTRRGSVWHVQARLRRADDANRATDFSPDASIVAR
jgi:plastocyanin